MKTLTDKIIPVLIAVCIAYILTACKMPSASSSSSATVPPNDTPTTGTPTTDTTDDTKPPLPLVETGPAVKLALSTADNGLFFEIEGDIDQQSNISPEKCGDACYTDQSLIVEYTSSGDVSQTYNNIVDPDLIVRDSTTYSIEKISPSEAFDLGALARDYTRIYKDSLELGDWFGNQYEAKDVIETLSGDIFIIDQNNAYRNLDNTRQDVFLADNLLIYNMDHLAKRAMITDGTSDTEVAWFWNFFLSAEEWLKSGEVWYSANGYEWDGSTLTENETGSLWVWNLESEGFPVYMPHGEKPIMMNAGTRIENNEEVIYWIECNTGWLIKYIPSIDSVRGEWRLYDGSGSKLDGIVKEKTLKPAMIDGELYFTNDGSVWALNLDTGVIEIYYAGEGEVMSF